MFGLSRLSVSRWSALSGVSVGRDTGVGCVVGNAFDVLKAAVMVVELVWD